MSIFSERVAALMSEHGLNQKDLAAKAGVTESAISYYLKGVRTPRSDVLTRIANALNTSTDYLLGAGDNSASSSAKGKLHYIQRNLSKLNGEQIERAENILKAVFDDIFDDNEGEE